MGGKTLRVRLFLFAGIMLLSLSVFAACTSNNEVAHPANDKKSAVEDEGKDDSQMDKADSSTGEFPDQVDLKIGDTGKVETTLGKYEISIDSITKEDKIDGRPSQSDYFFITDVTIKNIGDGSIDANESKGILEITQMLEGSGFTDVASFFDSIEEIEGTLEPGESISGQMLFEEEEADTYFIRFTEGLIAAGGVKNQVIWTFTLDEIDK